MLRLDVIGGEPSEGWCPSCMVPSLFDLVLASSCCGEPQGVVSLTFCADCQMPVQRRVL